MRRARPRACRSSTCPASRSRPARCRSPRSRCPSSRPGSYLVLATRQGIIKKTPLEQFERVRSTGIRAITLDEDDELAWVDVSSGEDDVIIATAQGMLAKFHESEVRAMGRDAGGVIGIRLLKKEGDEVVVDERRPARRRPARPDRDRLRQARLDRRVPDQAPRRPGRAPDLARGPQDRRSWRRSSRSPSSTRSSS